MKIGGGNQRHRHSRHAPGPGRHDPLRPLRRGAPEYSLGGVRRQRRQDHVYATADAKPDGGGPDDARDGLHGLPQPAVAHLRAARPRGGPGHGGRLDLASLPFAKKKGRGDPEGQLPIARRGGRRRFPAAFEQVLPGRAIRPSSAQRQAEVTPSAKQVLAICDRNIFPDMNVTWGKYPINIGHTDFPGCFRCHDGGHNAKNGDSHHAGLQRLPQPAGDGRSESEGPDRPGHHGSQARREQVG